jgi:protocatechuate 3,4-dioxygenase beta subunit
MRLTRRAALAPLAVIPAMPFLRSPAFAQAPPLELTPECRSDAVPTPAQTEEPNFRPDAPMKRDLAADVAQDMHMLIGGFVIDAACTPVTGALVQIWHADDAGRYDNRGHRLRGHQLTDARGAWAFSTIIPTAYRSRTPHYHFKVQRPGGRLLTTQLNFPDEPRNRRDREFDPRLVLTMGKQGGRLARFDFVVA